MSKRNKNQMSSVENTLWTSLVHKRWLRAVIAMASVVVFVTVYSLILPAAALTEEEAKATPGIELGTESEVVADGEYVEVIPEDDPNYVAQAEEVVTEDAAAAQVQEEVVQEVTTEPAAEETPAETAAETPAETVNEEPQANEAEETASTETVNETPAAETAVTEGVNAETAPATEGESSNTEEVAPAAEGESSNTEETTSTEAAEQTTEETKTEETAQETSSEEKTSEDTESAEEKTEEEKTEETAQETPVEVTYNAGTLTASLDAATVTVDYDANAQIADGASLVLGKEDRSVKTSRLYETVFSQFTSVKIVDADGNDVVPAEGSSVNVAVEYSNLPDGTRTDYVVVDGENKQVESLNVSVPSTFGTVVTKEKVFAAGTLTYEDEKIQVSVKYDESAKLPENCKLEVKAVEKEVEIDETKYELADSKFVALSILDADGNNITPVDGATVTAELSVKDVAEDAVRTNYVVADAELKTVETYDITIPGTIGAVFTTEKVIYEAGTLSFTGEDFKVVLAYNDESGIPRGAKLDVTEIKEDTKSSDGLGYDEYLSKTEAELDKKDRAVKNARFFDIKILDKKGNEIEPKGGVKVSISQAKAVTEEEKTEEKAESKKDDAQKTVVHFTKPEGVEEATAEEIETKEIEKVTEEVVEEKATGLQAVGEKLGISSNKGDQEEKDNYTFETSSFSVYGIIETNEITFELTNSNGEIYEVKVTFGKNANIPEGSKLEVTPFEKGSEDYEKALKVYLASQGENADVSGFAALDISIIDPNGNEIEPEDTVTVDMKIKSLPEVDNLEYVMDTMAIHHHIEKEDGSITVEKVQFQDELNSNTLNASFDIGNDVSSESTVIDSESINDVSTQENEISVEFETEDFSTYTISWNYNRTSTTVHYGYMNGNTFVEFTEQPSPVNVTTNYRTYLLYDFEGYTYSGNTYYRTTASNTPATGGTRIQAQLRYSQSNWRYHSYSTSDSNNNWQAIANNSHIYVTYNPETTPTTGGTPEIEDVSPEDWPQDPQTPVFSKSSTKNTDGTNTVSLSINGGEREIENSTKANVIVVLDVSGSMGGNNIWRLNTAKNAIYDMADTLLNDMSGVKMALITFSTTSSSTPVQGFTDNYTTFYNAVRGLTANGGTNWEQALFNANRLEVDDDAATFVVFVTDGDPTYRISRYNAPDSELYGYNREDNYFAYNVFGAGNSDPNDRAFDAAAEEVSSILANNKSFYAIGVSSDVTKVQDLVDEAGGGKAFLATDATALEEAFANITQSIKTTLGFGDVEITDGITELSNVEMKMMHEVDPDSFTYYKVTSSGQTAWDPASEGAGLASYDEETGAVKWDLGEGFQLEDGVTYMVTFRVWPSQEAYDLIADLNNGVKVYASGQPNSITDEEREQIQELAEPTATTQGRYTLKTNTNTVNATYSQTSSTGETVTVSGETDLTATYDPGTIENMDLESMKLTVKKVFEDDLTSGEDRETEVKLILKRRNAHQTTTEEFVPYAVPQTGGMSSEIVLNEGNNWSYSFYVAPGFEVDGEVLEHGYDFTITEPDIDYHYDLIEEIINPMVVDGEDVYYGDGELITGETTDQYTDQSLTAVNRVKSGIDIEKHVYDVDGTTEIYPETEFTITGQLLGPDEQPYTWQDGDSVDASGAYHKYDKDGNRIVYKGHFADSSNITFTLKAGERIRFINVPEGCTFQFTESTSGMDALGYKWMSTNAVTQHRTGPGEDFVTDGDVQPVVSGQIASLSTGVVGNKQYAVTYSNKRTIELPDVELVKVDQDDNTKKLNDAEFTLYSDEELTTPVTVDGNGNPISIKTGNKEGSTGPDGWYHIGLLPAGTYYLVETAEPEGYVHDETPIVITITKDSDSYSVMAVKNGENVLSGPTDGVYTITVDNVRATKYVKVFKYETGTNPEKALEGAQFSLTGPEGSGISYTGLTTNAEGYLVYNDSTLLELPINDSPYTLTETKAPDGYNMMTENVVFTVTAGGVTGTGSGYAVVSGTDTVDGATVTVYTIKVQNSAGVELPHTGGPGTLLYTLTGILFITGSVIGLSMRRRERRYN